MNESCQTCRHWTAPDPEAWTAYDRTFGRCGKVPQAWDIREWDEETMEDRISPAFADVTAVAQDGSSYSASLLTRADHYCSMHQPSGDTP